MGQVECCASDPRSPDDDAEDGVRVVGTDPGGGGPPQPPRDVLALVERFDIEPFSDYSAK